MKIVLVSNYFNHHQKPLSEALYSRFGDEYCFIETKAMSEERRKLGYDDAQKPAFLLAGCSNNVITEKAKEIIDNAEVVLTGSAPEEALRRRIRNGKVLFRFSERPLKQGRQLLKYLPRFLRWNYRNPKGKPIYMLCASAYAAADYRIFGLFHKRAYKWGYFPESVHYEDIKQLLQNKDATSILWCGRFLDWKHPSDAILVAKRLKECGYKFNLKFIGRGEEEELLHKLVEEYALKEYVSFLGSMKPEQVREHMERSGIYLFTSDRQEGWGAVLNEAMNSGCAVVASHEAGSTPYLVKNKENGLIYKSGDTDMLFKKLKYLLDHPGEQKTLGEAAYHTIVEEWNAEIAAERFLKLIESVLSGDKYPDLYESGPCSRAEVLREKRFDQYDK